MLCGYSLDGATNTELQCWPLKAAETALAGAAQAWAEQGGQCCHNAPDVGGTSHSFRSGRSSHACHWGTRVLPPLTHIFAALPLLWASSAGAVLPADRAFVLSSRRVSQAGRPAAGAVALRSCALARHRPARCPGSGGFCCSRTDRQRRMAAELYSSTALAGAHALATVESGCALFLGWSSGGLAATPDCQSARLPAGGPARPA